VASKNLTQHMKRCNKAANTDAAESETKSDSPEESDPEGSLPPAKKTRT